MGVTRGESLIHPDETDDQSDYTGHIRDKATGLTYMQARYYDPVIGRFLGEDPMNMLTMDMNPVYFNRYAYVGNDPLNWTDPTGMCRGGNVNAKCEFNTSISDPANTGDVNNAKAIGDQALQDIDQAIQGLDDAGSYDISAGGKTFTYSGSQIKDHWNNQSFTLTDESNFGNGGVGFAGNNNTTINAGSYSGWANTGGATFILLHDSFGHNSSVGTAQHLLNTGGHRASGLGTSYYHTQNDRFTSSFSRSSETFANQYARSLSGHLGLQTPGNPLYGF